MWNRWKNFCEIAALSSLRNTCFLPSEILNLSIGFLSGGIRLYFFDIIPYCLDVISLISYLRTLNCNIINSILKHNSKTRSCSCFVSLLKIKFHFQYFIAQISFFSQVFVCVHNACNNVLRLFHFWNCPWRYNVLKKYLMAATNGIKRTRKRFYSNSF